MEALLQSPAATPRHHPAWTGCLPLFAFTAVALELRSHVPAWELMWFISIAIFAGFKWWTWRRTVVAGTPPALARSLAYLFLWPGMAARKFLYPTSADLYVTPGQWLWAIVKTVFGATLLWGVARHAGHGLLAGWIGMVGFIFMLHFGLFALLAFFWQGRGIDAPPLMNCPIAAKSLHDFWGRRWNAGFHDIVFGLFFVPLARRCGATAAALLTFVISGLLHELVITIPAGGGYGLPTLYFTLQGAAMTLERARLNTGCGFILNWPGRAFAWAVVVLPIFALFPPVFVLRVMIPFLHVIQALS
jgi:alginate O-acetyltransferase complex protein AlgI